MIEAVFDSILIEPGKLEDRKKGSNIIIPDVGKEKNIGGTVVSAGPGKYTVTGQFIPTTIKVGDKVIIPPMGPIKIDFEGNTYYGCSETMVLAIIKSNE